MKMAILLILRIAPVQNECITLKYRYNCDCPISPIPIQWHLMYVMGKYCHLVYKNLYHRIIRHEILTNAVRCGPSTEVFRFHLDIDLDEQAYALQLHFYLSR